LGGGGGGEKIESNRRHSKNTWKEHDLQFLGFDVVETKDKIARSVHSPFLQIVKFCPVPFTPCVHHKIVDRFRSKSNLNDKRGVKKTTSYIIAFTNGSAHFTTPTAAILLGDSRFSVV